MLQEIVAVLLLIQYFFQIKEGVLDHNGCNGIGLEFSACRLALPTGVCAGINEGNKNSDKSSYQFTCDHSTERIRYDVWSHTTSCSGNPIASTNLTKGDLFELQGRNWTISISCSSFGKDNCGIIYRQIVECFFSIEPKTFIPHLKKGTIFLDGMIKTSFFEKITVNH